MNDFYTSFKKDAFKTKKDLTIDEENKLFLNFRNTQSEYERDYILSSFQYLAFDVVETEFKNVTSDKDDLIQEGTLGLLEAIKNYIPKGHRFSTYAKQKIAFAIKTYLLSNLPNGASVSRYNIDLFTKTTRIKSELYSELEREPSYEEIAKKLDNEYKPDEIRLNDNLFAKPSSIDEPLNDGETNREETISSNDYNDLAEAITSKIDADKYIKDYMNDSEVKEIDKQILLERLDGSIKEETILEDYQELAEKYKLPFSMIRSIDKKNIERLKHLDKKEQRGGNKWRP